MFDSPWNDEFRESIWRLAIVLKDCRPEYGWPKCNALARTMLLRCWARSRQF